MTTINESGGNVSILPVAKRREPKPGCTLEIVDDYACQHRRFKVDKKLATVECGICKARLDPMWVLVAIATEDWRLRQRWADMKAEIELMKPKLKTKCEHCNKLTPIPTNVKSWDIRTRAAEIVRSEADGQ